MMSPCLPLTAEEVRKLLGPDAYPRNYKPSTQPVPQARRRGGALKVFVKRMRQYDSFIICRYLEGYSPEQISNFLSAHPETVRIRIRKAGLFPTKSRGKPRKGASHPLVAYYRQKAGVA